MEEKHLLQNIKKIVAIIYGIPFVWIGIQHFTDPLWFEPIVPKILGNARFWVLLSGVFEIGIGLAIMIPKFRKKAAIAMVAMLVTLYWANLNMWVNNIPIGTGNEAVFLVLQIDGTLTFAGHIFRASIQILLITIALWLGELKPFPKSRSHTKQEE